MAKEFLVGEWLVQPHLGRMSQHGRTVAVRPKVMDLLVFMADRPGEVLSKDDLLHGVWGMEALSESALTRSITDLRQALGDSAEQPSYVETISKRGYRLIAPVAPTDRSASTGLSPIESERPRLDGDSDGVARPPAATRTMVLLAGALLAGAVLVGLTMVRDRGVASVEFGPHQRLTSEADLEIDPALSPDGRLVAYSAGQPGTLRILVCERAGGRGVPLTPTPLGDERRPRWSPDGGRILFTVGGTVYTLTPTGDAPSTLAAHAMPVRSATWAPDARTVLFLAGDGLFRVPADGGTPVRIRSIEPDATELAVSPDGARIAYVVGNPDFSIGTTQFANSGPRVVRLAGIYGGPPTDLSHRDRLAASPAWTADGRTLLFIADQEGYRDVYAVDIDRTGLPSRLRRITAGLNAYSLSVGGHDSWLAYSTFTRRANVWSVAIPALGTAQLSDAVPVTNESQTVETYMVSPDGRWLYFDSSRHGSADLFRVPVQGGEPERLTDGIEDEFVNDVSPDGRELSGHRFRNGRREVFVLRAGGGSPTLVGPGLGAMWSPDGSQLVVADIIVREIVGTTHHVVQRMPDGRWGPPRPLGEERCIDVDWRPDGHGFVAVCDGAVKLRALDGRVTGVLYAPRDERDPSPRALALSPGDVVYFKSYDGQGVPSVWSIPLGGGSPRLILRLDDRTRPSSRADFLAAPGRLFFTLEERQGDVWVTPVRGARGPS